MTIFPDVLYEKKYLFSYNGFNLQKDEGFVIN